MGFDVASLIIRALDKDEDGIPTEEGLRELMTKIDLGVRKGGWGLDKRTRLMRRIASASGGRHTLLRHALDQEEKSGGY